MGTCLTHTEFFSPIAMRLQGEDFRRHQPWIVGFCYGQKGLWFVERTRRAMDWETELLNSFETIVHRDFPNPRRIGCPGRDLLAGLAACVGDAQSALVLAHIRQCAPCFDELRELRKKESNGNVRQR
jgi:hypothetical protein